MKVLYVYDRGFHIKKLEPFLELVDAKQVNIKDVRLTDVNDIDVLIYQTFPGEDNPKKFNADIIEVTDGLFKGFSGLKLLFDAHEDGNADGYSRFFDLEPYPPIIKLFMGDDYINADNVVHQPDIEEPENLEKWLKHQLKPKTKLTTRKTYTKKSSKKKSYSKK